MPGFLETTLHQGYGYLEQTGYVDKARPYVEKARNSVPLIDHAAKQAEKIVPPLITRVDELAEPRIEKMRPYVEPRFEQVKETVTPYVNSGVEKYGVLREEGVKYYNVGLGKVEQIKEFQDAKITQIKELKDAKVTQIREFTDPKVEKIREFAEPKVEKIKGAVEPRYERVNTAIRMKKAQAQKLIPRVPKTSDLQGLKYETLLGKVACTLEKAEGLVDKYLPLPEDYKDSDSDRSTSTNASDTSYSKINRSLSSIKSRLLVALMIKVRMLLSLPMMLKNSYADGTLKAKVAKCTSDVKSMSLSKVASLKAAATKFFDNKKTQLKLLLSAMTKRVECLHSEFHKKAAPYLEQANAKAVLLRKKAEPYLKQANEKVALPVITKLAPTLVANKALFKSAYGVLLAVFDKALGKEKTAKLVEKLDACIPLEYKTALLAKKKM